MVADFVAFCYDVVGCLMESVGSSAEEAAFQMAPETLLIERAECTRGRQLLESYASSLTPKVDTLKAMLRSLSCLPLPLGFRLQGSREALRLLVVTIPFLLQVLQVSCELDKPIHQALHCLELLREDSQLYMPALTDLAFMLEASKSQLREHPPDEQSTICKRLKIREADSNLRLREVLMETYLELQRWYFQDGELLVDMDGFYKRVCNRLGKQDHWQRLGARQKLRHWFYVSEIYIQLFRRSPDRRPRNTDPERVRRALVELSREPSCRMLRNPALFNACRLGFEYLRVVKGSNSIQDYEEIRRQLEGLGGQDKVKELRNDIVEEMKRLHMRAVKILVARPLVLPFKKDRERDKDILKENPSAVLREADGWFGSCIDKIENKTTMTVAVDALTPRRLQEYLGEDCLIMFLRVDLDSRLVVFEPDKEDPQLFRADGHRMRLEEFRDRFDFRKVRILVVFGQEVRALDIKTSGYLIYVELASPNPGSISDTNIIHNQYCESYLPSFLEGLMCRSRTQNLNERIEEAHLSAHHNCLCDLANRTPRDTDLSGFVNVWMVPGTEEFESTPFVRELGASIIKKGSYIQSPVAFTTCGWGREMAELLKDLKTPGLFNIYEPLNHQCEMLCRELCFQVRRQGHASVQYLSERELAALLEKGGDSRGCILVCYISLQAEDFVGRFSSLLQREVRDRDCRVVLGTSRQLWANESGFMDHSVHSSTHLPLFSYCVKTSEEAFLALMRREFEKRGIRNQLARGEILKFYAKNRKDFEGKYLKETRDKHSLTMQPGMSVQSLPESLNTVPALSATISQPGSNTRIKREAITKIPHSGQN